MTYRIVNENGYLDFAPDKETAMRKLKFYSKDVENGYSKYVKIIAVDPNTKKEFDVKC